MNIEEIKAREHATTQGPWETKLNRHSETTGEHWGWIDGPNNNWCWSDKRNRSRADAEFIAHAREDIPNLIAEVESLKMQLKCRTEERDQLICDLNMANLNLDALTEQLAEKDNIIASIRAYETEAEKQVGRDGTQIKELLSELADSWRREKAAMKVIRSVDEKIAEMHSTLQATVQKQPDNRYFCGQRDAVAAIGRLFGPLALLADSGGPQEAQKGEDFDV